MKKLLALLIACLITSAAVAAPSILPVFQIRLIADAPAGDSETMTIVSKERREVLNVRKAVLLDQTALESAGVRTDELGHAQIEISFTDQGRKRFAEITREKVGQRLGIVIDGRLYCAPTIRTEITGGKAEISGSFSKEEANALAAKIVEAIKKH
jgi:preprotein translocase subunit SecD